MRKVYLLDCALRDGGYINDWRFGREAIKGFCKKIARTGIEILKVGFIKRDTYDPDQSLFPDVHSFTDMIQPKSENMMYVGMFDMSATIPLDRLVPCDGSSLDGIRVIFKKKKLRKTMCTANELWSSAINCLSILLEQICTQIRGLSKVSRNLTHFVSIRKIMWMTGKHSKHSQSAWQTNASFYLLREAVCKV